MKIYEIIKEKLRNDHLIKEIKYDNGVNYYSIEKEKDKNGVTEFYGRVNSWTAHKLSKETNSKIVRAERETIALNFKPRPIDLNCILL